MPANIGLNPDLDQGGTTNQHTRVYRGPTLGWADVFVKPALLVTTTGTTTLSDGVTMVFVKVAATVNIQLPDVSKWMQQNFNRPDPGFDGSIWIKDLGGNAATFNITVTPFGTQSIDLLAQAFTIVEARQLLRLYPLNDLSGWFSG